MLAGQYVHLPSSGRQRQGYEHVKKVKASWVILQKKRQESYLDVELAKFQSMHVHQVKWLLNEYIILINDESDESDLDDYRCGWFFMKHSSLSK